ncbi:MAG: DUF1493 family protein [Bacteroidetes bacterium]|nr:DUF1493 family protein [Bacteroidota bacterium]
MYSISDIIEHLEELTGLQLNEDTDLFKSGVTGDDFHEMIGTYSKKFSVDMDRYLWYFHTCEEGNNTGSFFFKPPNERVTQIPVTPKVLLDFANKGQWDIDYPEHSIPKMRIDILINILIAIVFVIFLIYSILH